MRLLLSAIKDGIRIVFEDDISEVKRIEGTIGGAVPAGSLDQAWRPFSLPTAFSPSPLFATNPNRRRSLLTVDPSHHRITPSIFVYPLLP